MTLVKPIWVVGSMTHQDRKWTKRRDAIFRRLIRAFGMSELTKAAGEASDVSSKSQLSKKEIIDIRQQHIGESLNQWMWYPEDPVHMVRASGQYMYDEHGRRYLDCINNVSHVGHCHPDVTAAAVRQMSKLNVNCRFLYEEMPLLAKTLTETMPKELTHCFFLNSGSEANDLAIRLARQMTKRFDLAVYDTCYHGQTYILNELRPARGRTREDDPPHVHVVPSPDAYRGKYRGKEFTEEELTEKYGAELQSVFQRAQDNGREIAAFMMEPIPCVGGQLVPPKGYLQTARKYTKQFGALFIADEVQSGFGRVGEHWWAFQIDGEDVVPDIVTMGKPMGNGHPLAALVTTKEIGAAMASRKTYYNSFGGNPVSCAIGLAVLDVIKKEKLMENAKRVGAYFKKRLRELSEHHKTIGDVRGIGLLVGVELVNDRDTREPATEMVKRLIDRLKEEQIILSRDGKCSNVLKFKPPMCINESDIDFLIEKLDLILNELEQ